MNKEIEVWKSLDFLGYPEYEVSTFGKVKSLNYLRTGKEKILKPAKQKNEYLQIHLYQNGKSKNFLVHRLVALAFIKNNYNYPCVNHKDEDPSNNHVDNLEFCTYKYNNNYGSRNERAGKRLSELNKGKKHTEKTKQKMSQTRKGKPQYKHRKPIYQYTKEGVFISEWQSATHAEKELNIPQGNICQCCKGKYKTAGGYIWRYKE